MTMKVKEQREHAVVLGASVSGLLAARVLADHFRHVTVVERDELPCKPMNRRGVPQGRHLHTLTARGCQAVEALFPGVRGQLAAHGAKVWADGDLSRLNTSFAGHPFPRSGYLKNPYILCFASRPLLEWSLRRRTSALSNVTILDKHELVSVTSTPDRARVTGVLIAGAEGAGMGRPVDADLVVDATGRGSRTPAFLDELGYGRPREQELPIRLVYASQKLRIPANRLTEHLVMVSPEPTRPINWALSRQEHDDWILSIGAMVGEDPLTDLHERLRYVEGRVHPDVLDAVARAEPLSDVTLHRVPSNRWRRYDKMRRFPSGLLVVGDAICSFNPIYGQGMTVAALEAIVLGNCLRQDRDNLAERFFSEAAKKVRDAWQTAIGADLTLPQVAGPRPLSTRVTNAYLDHVLAAGETDVCVAERFLRVIGMLDSPKRMLQPAFMLRVAMASRHRTAS
jgi:2-polyprenyl-6-methoxyphenol hydroxylase-like FAD-dependent oxidoreductase